MKLIIGIIILFGIVLFFVMKKNSDNSLTSKSLEKRVKFYSLDDGNQTELIISEKTTKKWYDSTQLKFDWNDFDEYDNRLWEYMYELFDKPVEKQTESDYFTIWNKLNRQQKVFWAFLAFSGDTDNGGVYQFIFNKPEFILAVGEMWNELGLEKIASDYESVLNELSGKTGKINELKKVFNDESNTWEKRSSSFADGYKELKSTDKIENYFYEKEFRRELYKTMADYIEKNIDKFTTLE